MLHAEAVCVISRDRKYAAVDLLTGKRVLRCRHAEFRIPYPHPRFCDPVRHRKPYRSEIHQGRTDEDRFRTRYRLRSRFGRRNLRGLRRRKRRRFGMFGRQRRLYGCRSLRLPGLRCGRHRTKQSDRYKPRCGKNQHPAQTARTLVLRFLPEFYKPVELVGQRRKFRRAVLTELCGRSVELVRLFPHFWCRSSCGNGTSMPSLRMPMNRSWFNARAPAKMSPSATSTVNLNTTALSSSLLRPR